MVVVGSGDGGGGGGGGGGVAGMERIVRLRGRSVGGLFVLG